MRLKCPNTSVVYPVLFSSTSERCGFQDDCRNSSGRFKCGALRVLSSPVSARWTARWTQLDTKMWQNVETRYSTYSNVVFVKNPVRSKCVVASASRLSRNRCEFHAICSNVVSRPGSCMVLTARHDAEMLPQQVDAMLKRHKYGVTSVANPCLLRHHPQRIFTSLNRQQHILEMGVAA